LDSSLETLYSIDHPIPSVTLFQLHATSSHTLCLVLGVATAQWVKSSNPRSPSLVSIILVSKFFIGSFVWYKFFFANTAGYVLDERIETVRVAQGCLLALSHTISYIVGQQMHADYYRRGFHKAGNESQVLQYYTICGASLMFFPHAWTIIHEWTGFDLSNPLLAPNLWSFLSMFMFSYLSIRSLRFYMLILGSVYLVSPTAHLTKTAPALYLGLQKLFEQEQILHLIGYVTVGIFLLAIGAQFGMLLSENQGSKPTTSSSKFISSQRSRKIRAKRFPPPFPNGWFRLLNSQDLAIGESKYVHACGHDFAVFRGENGKAVVLDAYCPHLGANIAEGGIVKDNCLQCPFHGWTFNDDGKCTHVPYSKSIPSVAKTHSWPVIEYGQMICVFYHIDRELPKYKPIPLPEVDEQGFVDHGSWCQDVNMHIQDFAENAADYAHFNYLHDNMGLPTFINNMFYLKHDITWHSGLPDDSTEENFSYFIDKVLVYFKWLPRFPIPQIVDPIVVFNGPGSIVYFRFRVKFFGEIILIKTFLPVGPLKVRVQDRYFADRKLPWVLVKFICYEALYAFKDDIRVWENKSYSFRPMVLKDDGPMSKVRRWYSKFYTENSVKAENTIDW